MLAMLLAAFGAAHGFGLLLIAGLPMVGLRYFNLLPFDRRLWWTFASVIALCCIRDAILNSYHYLPPTSAPDHFYFNVHMWGGRLGVVGGFFVGLFILFFVGRPDREALLRMWVVIPVATTIVAIGLKLIVENTVPMEQRRAEYESHRSALVTAIHNGDVDQLKVLDTGNQLLGKFQELGNRSPLDVGIARQDLALVSFLLAPHRGKTPRVTDGDFRRVLETKNMPLIEAILVGPKRQQRLGTGLRAAIENDDRGMISCMLQQGADPSIRKGFDTPLTICARKNLLDVAAQLIDLGADINGFHGSPDLNRGSTPLITAADHGHVEMVRLLLDNGADTNKTTALERSALQAACRRGLPELVKVLIHHGADVNFRSGAQKRSAFHWTLATGNSHSNSDEATRKRLVQILLDAGADPVLRDSSDNAAIDLAIRNEFTTIIELLR